MFKFTHNGRKVSSKQLFDGYKKELIAKAEDEIKRRLKSVIDPETGQPVQVTKQHRNGEVILKVEGSRQAIEAANKIIGAG